ncbi:MAG: cell wall-binding repeat-containing protein [Propionibacteriaceae bacterium]|nr:cell wall-binding repeat-containing protein [Propionibacteriaceae bacterium]
MGIKTRIAASAVAAVMALSVVPQAANALNWDGQGVDATWPANHRIGGLDRAQTAAKIADANGNRGTVILAVGRNFPDALAATPLADSLDAPVLLNDGGKLNNATSKWFFDNARSVKKVVVVGGEGIIPQSVLNEINAVYQQVDTKLAKPTFVRYAGLNRFETAYEISARTVAGYYSAGTCDSTGVSVTYTAKQVGTAAALAAADANLAGIDAKIAEYNAAKAKYEATKKAYDASVDKVIAAGAAYDKAIADQEAITKKLQVVGDLAALKADMDAKGQAIAAASAASAKTQGLYNELMAILDAAIKAGVEGTEETVWENLYATTWADAKVQLPALAGKIDAVVAEFGGTTIGATRNAADAKVAAAQAAVTGAQQAFAEATKKFTDAAAKDAANAALAKDIAAAAEKVVAAKKALDDAIAASAKAYTDYEAAAIAYAALVDDPALVPGAKVRAQAAVAKALDAVVAAADNVPVFLGTGHNFADALTAGPVAADQCGVILLTDNGKLSDPTSKWITSAKPRVVAAVGGPAATAAGNAATVKYIGADRFDTAKIINLRYLSDRNVLGIATGYDFPDALTGAALVANADGGLLLVNKNLPLPAATSAGIHGGKWNQLVVFGGDGVVSSPVAKAVYDIVKN